MQIDCSSEVEHALPPLGGMINLLGDRPRRPASPGSTHDVLVYACPNKGDATRARSTGCGEPMLNHSVPLLIASTGLTRSPTRVGRPQWSCTTAAKEGASLMPAQGCAVSCVVVEQDRPRDGWALPVDLSLCGQRVRTRRFACVASLPQPTIRKRACRISRTSLASTWPI